ncbi:transcription initiation factor tfiid 55 kDa subunit [Mitosporidium daphniae]|uniref:Transcription initiation factor tfiid 55 kDa subunit n=1 Tax=Mitosporidium daphniae TaxID=1485682 RepID=A0A098VZM5_9MICR|nr:transcription initiation factor tfiid 55 kDa subunit [Mitosporidium daphniae]KGG53211.1 transcription initiation factor tfiid 55 kDa subunit [Mitosporidium daphniae]|eukprot:XP_013239650.1 transcription initiation factor tfiid 55 kDa subunit [Mitosporidium daphniae]
MPAARPFSVTLTLPPPPLSVIGGGGPESLLETVVSLTSRKRRVITNASAILNDESKISTACSSKANHHPRATGIAFEEQIVVRFLSETLANAVRASLNAGTLDTDLQIDFDKSTFTNGYFGGPAAPPSATVIFCGQRFKGWLVDLPSLVESLISSNKKQYYKVADISQEEKEDKNGHTDDFIPTREWPHGLTPPLAFVRARRFRRQAARESLVEMSSVVRRLLEADRKALSIELELIDTPASSLEDRNFPELEDDEEDASSVASGPLASTIGEISDDEVSELAAEITYDEEEEYDEDEDEEEGEEGEEEEGEEEEEEIASEGKAGDPPSSDILSSTGHNFSLLQSRIYSRLASASTAGLNKDSDSFNRMNRFSDAIRILSQQSSSVTPESNPLLVEDYEVYHGQEIDEEEETIDDADKGSVEYVHGHMTYPPNVAQSSINYACEPIDYEYGSGSYAQSQDSTVADDSHSEDGGLSMDYEQGLHDGGPLTATSNRAQGDHPMDINSDVPEDLIDSYARWLYDASNSGGTGGGNR